MLHKSERKNQDDETSFMSTNKLTDSDQVSEFGIFKKNTFHADSCKPSLDIDAIDVKIS